MLSRDPDVAHWERRVNSGKCTAADRLRLAQLYLDRGEYTKALDQCELILHKDPLYVPAMVEVGEVYFRLNYLENALDCFNATLGAPLVPPAQMQFHRALCYYRLGQIDEAEKVLWLLINDVPDYVDSYDALIGLYEEQNHSRRARTLIRRRDEMLKKRYAKTNAY
jgi:tetratricopeptide (TPR) repeat protein